MIALAAALVLAAAAPSVTPARLPPVERCTGDPAFTRFRAALETAVKRKDAAALRRLASPTVQYDFSGLGSWDGFARQWDLPTNGKSSELWAELDGVLALGCAPSPDGKSRVFPGLFEDMGEEEDAFTLAVARPGTRLLARPDDKAALVATLDWSSATVIETEGPRDWINIKLADGKTGWARNDGFLSPLGYRLVVEQRGDRWVIGAFVAGD